MRLAAWSGLIVLALLAQAASPSKAQNEPVPQAVPNAAQAPAKAKAKSKAKSQKKAPAKAEQTALPAPATAAQKEAYAALPAAERFAIQSDLVWSGDLTGGLESEFGDRTIAAIRAFQKRNKFEETGILTPEQRQALSNTSRSRKEYVGWRLVEDAATPGVRLGVPSKLMPNFEVGTTGSRWSSARGEMQIETFREKMADTTLAELFEEMKRKPANRRVEASNLQTNAFSLSGMQGLKRFHVRVFMQDNEARGLTILFDQAMQGIMEPLVDRISSAYLPFGDAAAASSARRIEYGSGIVVTQKGHVLTERRLTDNCDGLIVAGLGRAERLAEEETTDLALLRVNGLFNLKPVPLSSGMPKSSELTLVGIAEPHLQGGARTATTAAARLRSIDGPRIALEATPARGFAGGAALDAEGRLAGMIEIVPPANGRGSAAPSVVPTPTIKKFLERSGVAANEGAGDPASARAAVVRVICVRR